MHDSPVPVDLDAHPPVSVFSVSLTEFERTLRNVGSLLSASQRTRYTTRYLLGVAAADVVAFSEVLLRCHKEGVLASLRGNVMASIRPTAAPERLPQTEREFAAYVEDIGRKNEEFETKYGKSVWLAMKEELDLTWPPLARLHACYRGFFFLLRSLQDRIYSVGLELNGQQAGKQASMSSAFQNGQVRRTNPVGALIQAQCPRYSKWFPEFRELRNTIKNGVPTSSTMSGFNLGIMLDSIDEERQGPVFGGGQKYYLHDATSALEASTEIALAMGNLCQPPQQASEPTE
jgi:hypothetical protein